MASLHVIIQTKAMLPTGFASPTDQQASHRLRAIMPTILSNFCETKPQKKCFRTSSFSGRDKILFEVAKIFHRMVNTKALLTVLHEILGKP